VLKRNFEFEEIAALDAQDGECQESLQASPSQLVRRTLRISCKAATASGLVSCIRLLDAAADSQACLDRVHGPLTRDRR
jgi:hypothetical protein